MRGPLAAIWTCCALLCLSGCRIPGLDGPVSRSQAASRHLCQQGVAAMEREQWQRAEELLQQAVKSCATDADSRRQYAETLWHRGAQAEAVKQMEDACRIAPDNAELHVRTAEMLLAMNHVEAAVRHARRALELDPKLPAAWAMRGRIMQANGQLREALAAYHRALGYGPSDRAIQLEIAELYRQMEQPERALALLQNLAETCSPGEEPQRLLFLQGLVYKELRRYDEAMQSFSAAMARAGPSAEILCQWGECFLAVGRTEEAAAAAREALGLDPQHGHSRQLLAQVEVAQRSGETSRR